MIRRFFALLLLTQLFVLPAFTQKLNTKKLDSLFHELDSNDEAMGSVSIYRNGHLLYEKAIGYSAINDEGKIPATTATKYRMASITKVFTATLIFQLIEEHKLSLDATIDT
jgi:D-alanyl-D-alanine carboxypeptidase